MPPQLIFDIAGIDLGAIVFDQEAIRQCNPQRGDMEHLNGIVYTDPEHDRLIGFKDVGADEFWVKGHIPGRPLLPGVLMIECAAQVSSFYACKFIGWTGFIGFGGLDDVRFRLPVSPGCRMYVLAEQVWHRHGRISVRTQGLVNGSVAFEATIIGVQM